MGGGFIWFLFGAGAATVLSRRRDISQENGGAPWGRRCPLTARQEGQNPPFDSTAEKSGAQPSGDFPHMSPFHRWQEGAERGPPWSRRCPREARQEGQSPPPLDSNAEKSATQSSAGSPQPSPFHRLQEEAERIKRSLDDSATDFSEATLNSLQSTLSDMKLKLEQQKVQREALRQRDAEQQSPPRLV